jgi:hypothetical protein
MSQNNQCVYLGSLQGLGRVKYAKQMECTLCYVSEAAHSGEIPLQSKAQTVHSQDANP